MFLSFGGLRNAANVAVKLLKYAYAFDDPDCDVAAYWRLGRMSDWCDLYVPDALVETGLMRHILPRFTLEDPSAC